jgi:hypothetical protein
MLASLHGTVGKGREPTPAEKAAEAAAKRERAITACINRNTEIQASRPISDQTANPGQIRAGCNENPDMLFKGGKNKRARSIKSRKNKRKSSKKSQSNKMRRSKSKKSIYF